MDGHGETAGQQLQSLRKPLLAVFEGLPGAAVNAAQEGTTYAALDAMVRAGGAGGNQQRACRGHGGMMGGKARVGYRKCPAEASDKGGLAGVLELLLNC